MLKFGMPLKENQTFLKMWNYIVLEISNDGWNFSLKIKQRHQNFKMRQPVSQEQRCL